MKHVKRGHSFSAHTAHWLAMNHLAMQEDRRFRSIIRQLMINERSNTNPDLNIDAQEYVDLLMNAGES